tara:strand:+ start:483 stop:695 length:213 start_codon:yes stop_codon:yes gene_type:complete
MRENQKVSNLKPHPHSIPPSAKLLELLKEEGLLEEDLLSVEKEPRDDLENQDCSYPSLFEDEDNVPDFLK